MPETCIYNLGKKNPGGKRKYKNYGPVAKTELIHLRNWEAFACSRQRAAGCEGAEKLQEPRCIKLGQPWFHLEYS